MFDCILSCFVVYVSLHVPLICLTENRKPQVRVGVWDRKAHRRGVAERNQEGTKWDEKTDQALFHSM